MRIHLIATRIRVEGLVGWVAKSSGRIVYRFFISSGAGGLPFVHGILTRKNTRGCPTLRGFRRVGVASLTSAAGISHNSKICGSTSSLATTLYPQIPNQIGVGGAEALAKLSCSATTANFTPRACRTELNLPIPLTSLRDIDDKRAYNSQTMPPPTHNPCVSKILPPTPYFSRFCENFRHCPKSVLLMERGQS